MPHDRAHRLRALRARLESFDPARRSARTLRFGDARVDGCFPAGGLPLGCWHDLTGSGAEADDCTAPAAFAAKLAGVMAGSGQAVWVLRRDDLYAPGAAELGLKPSRLLVVRAASEAEALAAMEDALATRGIAAVVGEVEHIDLTAGRRLQLACERRGSTAMVLRRRLHGVAHRKAVRAEPAVAASRWRIACAPSEPEPGEPGLGPLRWAVELERTRGGRTGGWLMQEDWEADHGAVPLRVVAELGDHALSAGTGFGNDQAFRRAAG